MNLWQPFCMVLLYGYLLMHLLTTLFSTPRIHTGCNCLRLQGGALAAARDGTFLPSSANSNSSAAGQQQQQEAPPPELFAGHMYGFEQELLLLEGQLLQQLPEAEAVLVARWAGSVNVVCVCGWGVRGGCILLQGAALCVRVLLWRLAAGATKRNSRQRSMLRLLHRSNQLPCLPAGAPSAWAWASSQPPASSAATYCHACASWPQSCQARMRQQGRWSVLPPRPRWWATLRL